jgi:predicted Zn-dependent peptidase
VLKLLRAELVSLLEEGIREDELRRAKDKWISSKVLGSESTYARMNSLASDWVIYHRLMTIDEEIARIEQVTTEDVMRTLHRFPLREKQVLTALGPVREMDLLA